MDMALSRSCAGLFPDVRDLSSANIKPGGAAVDVPTEEVIMRVPKGRSERVEYFESHLPVWAADPAGIGTTPEMVAELQAATDEARGALAEQQQMQNAAQAATSRYNDAVRRMGTVGVSIIFQIQCKARMDGREVYAMASIAAPAKASPIAAPGKPSALRVDLTTNGSLLMQWKCRNPRGAVGTTYRISRQLGESGPYEYLGFTGEKKFEDITLPRGTALASYQIQAARSTRVGAVASFPVTFGVDPGTANLLKLTQGRGVEQAA